MSIAIDLPPVNDPFVDGNGYLTAVWRDWFSTNVQTLITYLTPVGLQLPPITSTERDSIANPTVGLTIQNTTLNNPQVYVGSWKTFNLT